MVINDPFDNIISKTSISHGTWKSHTPMWDLQDKVETGNGTSSSHKLANLTLQRDRMSLSSSAFTCRHGFVYLFTITIKICKTSVNIPQSYDMITNKLIILRKPILPFSGNFTEMFLVFTLISYMYQQWKPKKT